jgi:hypothetical protein
LALAEYTLRPELQPELQLAFSAASEESVRLFLLPEAKTVIRLEWRDPQVGSTEPPHFQQWAFEQGAQQMVGSAMITATKGTATTQIGGVTYQWAFWSYAVLDIAYQPGRWLLASGAVLALLGAAAQFVPSRQAWAIVQASEEGSVITLRVQSRFVDPHHEAPFQAILGALALETEHLVWL